MTHIDLNQGLDQGEAVENYKTEKQQLEEEHVVKYTEAMRKFCEGFYQKFEKEKGEDGNGKNILDRVVESLND